LDINRFLNWVLNRKILNNVSIAKDKIKRLKKIKNKQEKGEATSKEA